MCSVDAWLGQGSLGFTCLCSLSTYSEDDVQPGASYCHHCNVLTLQLGLQSFSHIGQEYSDLQIWICGNLGLRHGVFQAPPPISNSVLDLLWDSLCDLNSAPQQASAVHKACMPPAREQAPTVG